MRRSIFALAVLLLSLVGLSYGPRTGATPSPAPAPKMPTAKALAHPEQVSWMAAAIPEMEELVREHWGEGFVIDNWQYQDLNLRSPRGSPSYASCGFWVLEPRRLNRGGPMIPVRVGHADTFAFELDEAASQAARARMYRLTRFAGEAIPPKPGRPPKLYWAPGD
jgi:hypothetical protein